MRAVLQRVKRALVTVEGNITGAIEDGLLVLLGIEEADTLEDMNWLSSKLVNLRIFNDEQGVMNRSLLEVGGGLLLVSQFTLFAATKKGNRPSYSRAAPPAIAVPIYEKMIELLSAELGKPIHGCIWS